MDDPDASVPMLEAALVELPRINAWLGGYLATLKTLDAYRRYDRPSALRILDVGTGIGDYPFEMVKWGLKRGVDVHVTALDLSPETVAFAIRASDRQPAHVRRRVEFVEGDALSLPMSEDSYDICTSALFLHHLTEDECRRSIKEMCRVASKGIIVNDIHRHLVAYYGIRIVTRILPFSHMVRHDGPVSVLRAFRRSDLCQVAETASLHGWGLRWHWAFRWVLTTLPQA